MFLPKTRNIYFSVFLGVLENNKRPFYGVQSENSENFKKHWYRKLKVSENKVVFDFEKMHIQKVMDILLFSLKNPETPYLA